MSLLQLNWAFRKQFWELNSAVAGKLKAMRNELGKRPPEGAGKWVMRTKSVRINTKNEPVVGRNIYHRAWPWQGAKLTPWLWIGGTKEVRTLREMWGDPGRHGRCVAIEGRAYTRPCRTKNRDVLLCIPKYRYFCTRYWEISITLAHSSESKQEKNLDF